MDEMRRAFEAWANAEPREWDVTRFGEGSARWPGQYFGYVVQASWEAWQAACTAEREVCAQVCQERAEKFEGAAQRADARGAHDDAVSYRATEWQLTVCAKRIRARSQQ